MCEAAIHVLKSVFTRHVRQNAFASAATLMVVVFLRIHHRLVIFVTLFLVGLSYQSIRSEEHIYHVSSKKAQCLTKI